MLNNRQTYAVIGFAAIIWLGLALTNAVSAGLAAVWDVVNLIPLLIVAGMIFEHWAWRWAPLHPHLVGTPVVSGTWRGELKSMWVSKETGVVPPPKTVFLAIDQTLFTVTVRMLTNESESDQLVGSIAKLANGKWVIAYAYDNTSDLPLREGSRPHFGGAVLTIVGDPPDQINGEYWTDRDTKGTFTMDARAPVIAQSFALAQAITFGQA